MIEQREFLEVHLAALKPSIRTALVAWSQGESSEQIAAAAGVTPRAIRKRINIGILQIRKRLENSSALHA